MQTLRLFPVPFNINLLTRLFVALSHLFLLQAGAITSVKDAAPSNRRSTNLHSKPIRFRDVDPQVSLLANYKLDEFVIRHVRSKGLSDQVYVVPEKRMQKKTGRKSVFFSFQIEGVKIESYHIKANRLIDGSVFINGSIPIIDNVQTEFEKTRFPSISFTKAVIARELSKVDFSFDSKDLSLSNFSKCASIRNLQLQKANCVTASHLGVTYRFTVDQIGLVSKVKTTLNGFTRLRGVYLGNSSGPKADHIVYAANGRLENSRFNVMPDDGGAHVDASKENITWSDNKSSSSLQIHAYSFANRIIDWFELLGISKIRQKITIKTGQNNDNASFTSNGVIELGSGVQVFNNMGLDIDVVAHEVGHFIVWQGIQFSGPRMDESQKIHTAAIHEGLADFFTFASTGDACLAESICSADAFVDDRLKRACEAPTCLRLGENIGFTYGDSLYQSFVIIDAFHKMGQLVSATLWDARKKQKKDDLYMFDRVVLNSLDYTPMYQLSYGDLMLSVMASDKELTNGKFCEDIYTSSQTFGIDELMDGDCTSFNTSNKENRNILSLSYTPKDDYFTISQKEGAYGSNYSGKLSREKSIGCASLGLVSYNDDIYQNIFLLFIGALPLFYSNIFKFLKVL